MQMKKYKLGELMEVTRGMSLGGEFYSTKGELMRLTLGNFDYKNNCFKDDKSKNNLFFTGAVKPEFILKKDDIITPLTEQAIGLLGSTAKIPCSGKYIQSQDVALIKCNEKLNPNFAFYLISSKLVRNQLSAAAQQTKIRHTSPDKIKNCIVWIPEYSAQEKIGNFLSSIDEKIALNNRINEKLEQLAKRLYDYWFVQFDFPNSDGKPYKSSGGKMAYNAALKREIPEGLGVCFSNQLCSILAGKQDSNFSKPDGIYEFFTCSNETLYCDDFAFNGSSVLIAGNGDFNVKHFSGKFNAYQRTYVLIPDEKYYSVLYWSAFEKVNSFKKNSRGSIVKFISKSDVENISIYKGAPEICYSILNQIMKKIEHINYENKKLLRLKNKLMPLLINGQVVVE